MRLRSALFIACSAAPFAATPAPAQQPTQSVMPQFVLNATTAINQELCYWGGVPYSGGARVRTLDGDHDPHVTYQVLICKDGNWLQE